MNSKKSLIAVALVFTLGVFAGAANAQPQQNWREKIKSAKIGYLTAELDLTSAEAEVFWPVYNKIENEKHEAMRGSIQAYKNLEQAISDKKSEKEITKLLEAYIQAKAKVDNLEGENMKAYLKVLSADKVAKLYIHEERFRRQQISKFSSGRGGGQPPHRN